MTRIALLSLVLAVQPATAVAAPLPPLLSINVDGGDLGEDVLEHWTLLGMTFMSD